MGIADEDIARVRESADFAAVVGQHLQLRKVGRRWVGLCPFHAENTPSFSVNAEQGLYYCFGCGAKGDVITFVREIDHLDFVGAVESLAARAGITLRYTDQGEGRSRRERAELTEVLGRAVAWYHQRLLAAADAGTARGYLRSRGIDGDRARAFRLGWAPDDWDALARHLEVSDRVLEATGLGFTNRRNRQQDSFRGRILFPIFDPQGNPVGFGGRKLPGADGPKYRNSAQTRLYDKSKVLYGLNWAKDEMVRTDEVVVCEGYTDVIGLASVGIGRAVATCGTSLTEEHVATLQRFARRLVLAFDPDTAGQAAAARVYAWERTHDIEVGIADLPAGTDPGDLAREDPERLRVAVAEPVPFLGFRVAGALGSGRMDTPEGRARTAEAALAVVAEHPDELVRDQYLMEIADRCRLDVSRLRQGLAAVSRKRARDGGPSAVEGPSPAAAENGPEPGQPAQREVRREVTNQSRALRLALDAEQGPEMRGLLHEVLFDDELHRRAWRALTDADGDVGAAIANADPDAADLLGRLVVADAIEEPRDLRRVLLRDAAHRRRAELQRVARQAEDPGAQVAVIGWLQAQLEAVAPDARPTRATEDALLDWLADQPGDLQ